jgi:hypothetical protein
MLVMWVLDDAASGDVGSLWELNVRTLKQRPGG